MKELFTALAKAQAKMGKAAKDSTNPHFRSKYADLTSCTDTIRDVIGEFGLGYIQVAHDSDKSASVETIIFHESGTQISCGTVSVPVSKIDAQGFGSALTYARRYSLSAAFGLATDDDDGNAATQSPQKPSAPKPAAYDHSAAMSAMGKAEDTKKIAKIIETATNRGASQDQLNELAGAADVRAEELGGKQ